MRKVTNNYKILCACGCGELIDKFNKWGYERIFKHNHHMRGERNNHWNGGQFIKPSGYRMIYSPNHHFATQIGFVAEHRLVWEKRNNAVLLPWADVHHINEDKLDNRIENLHATTKSNHTKLHSEEYRNKVMSKRTCVICNSNTTRYRKDRNQYDWYFLNHDKSKPLCENCYKRLRK